MDAPEPLLNTVRVPGKVIVDHEVRALEVKTLPCRIGGHEDDHVGVARELFLDPRSLLTGYPAVYRHHGILAPKQRGDSPIQVVESVPVLRKDDELARCTVSRRRAEHAGVQDRAQLHPLGVLLRIAHTLGLGNKRVKRGDLRAELLYSLRGRRSIENFLLDILHLGGGIFLVVGAQPLHIVFA